MMGKRAGCQAYGGKQCQTVANVDVSRIHCYPLAMARGREDPKPQREGGIEQRFLTLDEVAIYLNVSVPQAYAMVRSGELPAIKIGGRGVWRVDRRQLEAYIEQKFEETREWARDHPLSPRDRVEPT